MKPGSAAAGDEPRIHRALAHLHDTTGLPLTFGGAVNSARQLRLTEFAGPITGALRGVTLDFGRGLGGKVVALRRPIVVNDYVATPAISHDYDHIIAAEGLRAMVAVPVVVHRTTRAVLYGSIRSAVPLGDRIVASILDTARDLEQDLAVRDELARRMDWLEDYPPETPAPPRWELVREAYAELRVLAKDVDDTLIQQRVETICRKLSALGDPAPRPHHVPALSARELDVLACVALGWTNTQIANDLHITTETVKSYLRSAMRKLQAHSRLEAVVSARRLGLMP